MHQALQEPDGLRGFVDLDQEKEETAQAQLSASEAEILNDLADLMEDLPEAEALDDIPGSFLFEDSYTVTVDKANQDEEEEPGDNLGRPENVSIEDLASHDVRE